MKTAWLALLTCAPGPCVADNLIRDLGRTPRSEVAASCERKDWVACRELGERAHYGKGVPQDLGAAGRLYEQAGTYGDTSASSYLKRLHLDARCAALGATVSEPGTIKDVEDCAVDYYAAKADGKGAFEEAVECARRVQQAETLAMLYANGHGVPRDLDRAIRAACEYRDVSAERDGMLETLFSMKEAEDDAPFDFCAFATSGHTGYRCSVYAAGAMGAADDALLDAARAAWSPAALAEWQKLEPIADAFFEAEASAQTYEDRFGTAHLALYEEALTEMRHAFVEWVGSASAFDPTQADGAKLKAWDRELNAVYGRSLKAAEDDGGRDAMRAAERAWIRYRDAAAAFFAAVRAGHHPPPATAQAVCARLTRERVEQLKKAMN
jgi:uncharacterized protein YecT (DUF1311 family)